MTTVAVIGASANEERYSNKAMKMLAEHGHTPVPIAPTSDPILGRVVFPSLADQASDKFLGGGTVGIPDPHRQVIERQRNKTARRLADGGQMKPLPLADQQMRIGRIGNEAQIPAQERRARGGVGKRQNGCQGMASLVRNDCKCGASDAVGAT